MPNFGQGAISADAYAQRAFSASWQARVRLQTI